MFLLKIERVKLSIITSFSPSGFYAAPPRTRPPPPTPATNFALTRQFKGEWSVINQVCFGNFELLLPNYWNVGFANLHGEIECMCIRGINCMHVYGILYTFYVHITYVWTYICMTCVTMFTWPCQGHLLKNRKIIKAASNSNGSDFA